MGRQYLTQPTGGRRASATATQTRIFTRGRPPAPPPPPVTDRPQPHKAPTGTRAAEPSKSPPSPGGGRANGPARSDSEGGWGPHQGHGGRGTGGTRERTQGAPWATKAGPAGETDTGSHRHTPGRSRDAWDTGARLWRPSTSSPTHTQEPRRQGASTRQRQQPHTPDGPRAISRPSNHPDLHARRSTATPRERSPGATTRAEGEERAGPSPTHVPTAARRRPVAARGGEQGKLRAARSRHSPGDAQDGPRAPPPSPGRQGNTRRVTRKARAHTGTRAGPQHEERATDRQPGPAGPSPDTEGGGAGRGH